MRETDSKRVALPHQDAIGLSLAGLLLAAWSGLHVWALFLYHPHRQTVLLSAGVMLLACWLSVGLFIVAHDAMHRSLAPRHPVLERALGTCAIALYACFSFSHLLPKHHAHHRHVGTEDDPDFSATHPTHLGPWFLQFMRRYFGWREFGWMTLRLGVYLALGAPLGNILAFFAVPIAGSALQLFYFGTYLPHRHADAFADEHRARSNAYGYLASLLSCFHFGYHHEHHRRPQLPWWALPGEFRRGLQ